MDALRGKPLFHGTSMSQNLFRWLRGTVRKSMLPANECSAAPKTSLITTTALTISLEAHVFFTF